MSDKLASIALNVNGKRHEVEVRPHDSLADILREKLGLTGTKIICNEGHCGACTVLIDGVPVLSCLTLAIECEGKEILTIEGLCDPQTGELHPIQQAFVDHSGMQCGSCTPGMILAAKALLDENPHPTAEDVREALAGNICRCGNYNSITRSVLAAAEIIAGRTHNG